MDRIRNILTKSKSKIASNSDVYFNISLDSESKLLPSGEVRKIVNIGDIFDKEREECKRYRLITTITTLFTNVLMNISGNKGPNTFGVVNGFNENISYGLQTFDGYTFKNDPYTNDFTGKAEYNYDESYDLNLKEVDGWFGFYNPDPTTDGLCKFYELEPTSKRFDLIRGNWDFTITYPYDIDKQHYIVNNGLLITNAKIRTLGGKDMIAFGSIVPHNLNVGDTVRLTNMQLPNMNGDFEVLGLGLENGDSKETFFVVNLDSSTPTESLFNYGRMKRVYFNQEVEYYFRKFKKVNGFQTKLPLIDGDYEVYRNGFSINIFNDDNYQIIFNDDIDIDGLKDNLNRPLSEIYLTIIKNESNNTFTNIQSGLDLENYIGNVKTNNINNLSVSNIRKMHTISTPLSDFDSHIAIESDVKITNGDYYGDICEYSKMEVKETILYDLTHRFNTIDRETTISKPISNGVINGPRNEGYLYKPHHKIKIREFSNYIEQGDDTTVGIPEYAEPLGDGRYIWRDVLSLGYTDNEETPLDYPFVNNSHYIHNNICFLTKRQDPFGEYDLLYTNNTPKDIIGDSLNDNFTIKSGDNEC